MTSRVGRNPITIPAGVEIKCDQQTISVKGKLGELSWSVHRLVRFKISDNTLCFEPAKNDQAAIALTGTSRALLNNMVRGVSEGFEKKLELHGVGYRAQLQGNKLVLALGFSHPVEVIMPVGITAQVPSQTEIVLKGVDKQKVYQLAADIRGIRPPEPYKGKGVRYAGEVVILKETKK